MQSKETLTAAVERTAPQKQEGGYSSGHYNSGSCNTQKHVSKKAYR